MLQDAAPKPNHKPRTVSIDCHWHCAAYCLALLLELAAVVVVVVITISSISDEGHSSHPTNSLRRSSGREANGGGSLP
jgi:hypothetical protein